MKKIIAGIKNFFADFQAFVNKGNVLDMAVGIIIGGAFKDIVTSLIDNIISPVIGLIFKADFNHVAIHVLGVDIKVGAFITGVINFVVMAFVVFLILRGVNFLRELGNKKEEEAPAPAPNTKKCPYCCTEIAIEATRCPHCTSQLGE